MRGLPPVVRDALYELSMSEEMPKKDRIDALIQRFPDYEIEIIGFAVELVNEMVQDAE